MIDSRTFHVHSHAAKAFSVMHELRLQEQLCDVVLSVSGTKFHAHKVTAIIPSVWSNVNQRCYQICIVWSNVNQRWYQIFKMWLLNIFEHLSDLNMLRRTYLFYPIIFFFFFLASVLSLWDFSHWKFGLLCLWKASCDSHATQPTVHVGCCSVSTILDGIFNMCTDVNACNCTWGVLTHVREFPLKVDAWIKIPWHTGEPNLPQWCADLTYQQLSYIPTPLWEIMMYFHSWSSDRSVVSTWMYTTIKVDCFDHL